jgi:hypothetical protein
VLGRANDIAEFVDSGSYTVRKGAKSAAKMNIAMITAPIAPKG